MDGGHHDDFLPLPLATAAPTPVPGSPSTHGGALPSGEAGRADASERTVRIAADRASRVHRPARPERPRTPHERPRTPHERPRAFHYATARTLLLGQIAEKLSPALARTLGPRARRMQVIAVRLSSRAGSSVHATPTLTSDALFIDHRDLAALDAGAIVPDLEDVIGQLR